MPEPLRRIFWFVNKFFMVPMFRLGLGFLFGNPLSGYIMVIKVHGRKSGKLRFAPVNYALQDGMVYCISGGRRSSDWFKNLLANPRVELILPAGAIYGAVEEVPVEDVHRLALIRQVLKNAGFAGYFEGYNPNTISEADLANKCADLPLLRIRPIGLGSGAGDAGGWAWFWTVLLSAWLAWLIFR